MRSVRAFLTGAIAAGIVVVAAACGSDFSTQPTQPTQADAPARSLLTPSPLGSFSRGSLSSGQYYATVKFTIDPRSATYVQIGPHYLYIPAGAVCDPATSGYGVMMWALPCNSATRSIDITAKASLQNGHPLVEFDTHLRFKPSRHNEYDVMLYLRDDNTNGNATITWCPDTGSVCYDESKTSPAQQLNTRWDGQGKWVYRRIQHFSGFNVVDGHDNCDPADPNCQGAQQ